MRKGVALGLLLLTAFHPVVRACEVCGAKQPEILRGLTHGSGPQGNFDYVIVLTAVVVVLFALVYAVKCLVRPGERETTHIKRVILEQDYHGS